MLIPYSSEMPGTFKTTKAGDFFKCEISIMNKSAGKLDFHGIFEFDDGVTRAFFKQTRQASHTCV